MPLKDICKKLSILCIGFIVCFVLTLTYTYTSLSILCIGFLKAWLSCGLGRHEAFNSLYWIHCVVLTSISHPEISSFQFFVLDSWSSGKSIRAGATLYFQFFVLDSDEHPRERNRRQVIHFQFFVLDSQEEDYSARGLPAERVFQFFVLDSHTPPLPARGLLDSPFNSLYWILIVSCL